MCFGESMPRYVVLLDLLFIRQLGSIRHVGYVVIAIV